MLAIDLDDPEPIYLQIVRGLKQAIAAGELLVGDRLPSVRQLAGDLAINLNTVARAYRLLEGEGFVRVRHGRGVEIVRADTGDPEAGQAAFAESVARAVVDARVSGMSPAEIKRVLTRAAKEL